ncbi:MAG: hypothetical protein IPP02_14815 [Chitinophagaceae bacterium]|nr:hypothetical protein [Chitinophagaceae bacterium]
MLRQFSRNLYVIALLFSINVSMISCSTADKENIDNADPDNIYFDYKVTAAEGDDNLTVMLQYMDGEGGDAFAVEDPGQVMLDGEQIAADSTKMSGFFYELHKPIAAFAGKHSISFTDVHGKEYKEEFDFKPIVLLTQMADTAKRDDLIFEFAGLEPEDFVRVLLTDTSYINEGINEVYKVLNGRLAIKKTALETLANGPVQLEFIREYERPVKNGTQEGGRLLITYSLKRDFFLKD